MKAVSQFRSFWRKRSMPFYGHSPFTLWRCCLWKTLYLKAWRKGCTSCCLQDLKASLERGITQSCKYKNKHLVLWGKTCWKVELFQKNPELFKMDRGLLIRYTAADASMTATYWHQLVKKFISCYLAEMITCFWFPLGDAQSLLNEWMNWMKFLLCPAKVFEFIQTWEDIISLTRRNTRSVLYVPPVLRVCSPAWKCNAAVRWAGWASCRPEWG